MRVSKCRVLRIMDVRCLLFKLLLFQMLVAWCAAKHVTIQLKDAGEVEKGVQESIRNMLTGIYSHQHLDPSQVQVVHPVKVTRHGELVSHAVEHAHEHGHARARRDLHYTEQHQPHVVHYNLTVDGKDLRLDLRPSVTFITPAMVVERHKVGERSRDPPRPDATACHYTGSVRGQPSSSIALSACDGLAGLLWTEHGEYWIEPSNHVPIDSSQPRPHVIFKRSAVDKVKAWHRAKREVDSKTRTNDQIQRTNYEKNTQQYNKRPRPNPKRRLSKEAMDKRRREYLERRQKMMEMMRKDPAQFRRHQAMRRMEERRLQSNSKSGSVENSKSTDQASLENRKRNRSRLSNEQRLRRIRNRRRRKRSKNCATKQPSYIWKEKNMQSQEQKHYDSKDIKNHRRYPHHRYASHTNSKRTTRSVSKPRHVEVLLVADHSMTDFHNQSNLETYLLTIMNMVSSLYMNPSIGNYIKVVVVKIILVEEIEAAPDLEVSTDADGTLASFCRWQHQRNPDNDDNPHHHDVAILVTRQDICSQHDAPCSTLGVAHVAGMCKPDRSCSVNEDNGIMLAHTITHELGHNFGLYHDTEKIGCHRREGSTLHIMTPIFESDTVQVAWSRCSKRDVTNFLDAGLGECLSDRPSQEPLYVYPEVPAGVTFDAASQCHLQFGAEAVVCAKPPELCEHLWCQVNYTCKTMLRPAAPGTTCGPNMWCQNQTCVARTPSPVPRDGGWGPWSEWSECSRTCGAGVSTQSRECNNPEPHNNGNYCIGDRSRYKICNIDPCPINEPSFREVQCSKHNNMTYRNETISEWIPYFDQDKPCELQCVSRDGSDVEMLGGFVADGTPCRQSVGARDMCIAGVCYKVGCDWIVGSETEEDKCGVCGGNGSACKTVQGIYSKDTTRQSEFSEVAIIPAGSRNVKIQEKVNPGNYIFIRSEKSKKMYPSGARNATLSEYFVAGTQAIYERDRDWEKVRIIGPLAEDIKVYQRIYRGRHRNPGVTYQYTVDSQRVHPRYRYRVSDWSPCSVTCGIGNMRRHLECYDEHNRAVELSQCYHIEPPRHEALMQQCRAPACPAREIHTHWWVGAWNPCSKPCHMPGEEATKQRNVYCVDKITNKVIDESECDRLIKPISTIKCADVPAC
ncbi:A disintegrin and metalloproteinase with thrombospondin motifs 12 [Trichoplusia ni]|uniref:A disintegrin and metalloproteinase with thrombospondin motifs 12 n=1 Tax=Trichoplusia ni TaxID=7111 RepID=A0A7E5WL80_TRINI|nr:A disintegrin and metalloproteinase with thrombospondin motifs 12 [Trichoplusia ni]XP_026741440.1 A disintegrin and metalloproteinase with thrombospondin motifs 12 [Trichoplusia ni]